MRAKTNYKFNESPDSFCQMFKPFSLCLALATVPLLARADDSTFSSLRAAIRADIASQQHPRMDGVPPQQSDRINLEQTALSALEESSFDSSPRAERNL